MNDGVIEGFFEVKRFRSIYSGINGITRTTRGKSQWFCQLNWAHMFETVNSS